MFARRPFSVALLGSVFLAAVTAGCGPKDTPKDDVKPGAAPVASRKTVKTATDPDSGQIDAAVKDTTIEEILAQKDPTGGKPVGRVAPFETTTWRVHAQLKSVELKKDGDFYLVMQGEKGGQTVVEVPDPKLCEGSPLQPQIAAARKLLEDRYHPTSTPKEINDQATVTGVGFLGFGNRGKKSATGHSGPRLMPGTGFEF